MTKAELKDQLLKEFDKMSWPSQLKLLSYAVSLNRLPNGTPGTELLRFAGTISREDCEAMMKVIEEDCEQVDPNDWQ